MRLLPVLFAICLAKASFFDVCPANRQSIGECLAGLCPFGSKCINNHCCIPTNTRKFTTHRRRQPVIDSNLIVDIEKIRRMKGGPCYVRGNEPIGVCLGDDICPVGYTCENDSCCNVEEGRRLRSRKRKRPESEEDQLTEEEEDVLARERGARRGGRRGGRREEEEDEGEDEEEDDEREEEETEDGEEEEEEEEKSEERYASDEERREENEEEPDEDEDLDMIRANRRGFRRNKAKRKPRKFTEQIPEAEEVEEKPAEIKNVCPIGYPIGECVSRQCPDGYSCYKNSCCVITPEINCEDTLPRCHSYLCDIDGYSEFMAHFCPKTCAKCTTPVVQSGGANCCCMDGTTSDENPPDEHQKMDPSKSAHRQSSKKPVSTSTISSVYGNYEQRERGKGAISTSFVQQSGVLPELCTDRRSDCGEWANSGFCTSAIYSTAQKMKFCGRSCGYC